MVPVSFLQVFRPIAIKSAVELAPDKVVEMVHCHEIITCVETGRVLFNALEEQAAGLSDEEKERRALERGRQMRPVKVSIAELRPVVLLQNQWKRASSSEQEMRGLINSALMTKEEIAAGDKAWHVVEERVL